MLVLSRRPGQKVVFPGLGISVEVLRSHGTVTQLGIEAPGGIPVLRDELLDKNSARFDNVAETQSSPQQRQQRHEWRNRLNQVTLKLQLLPRQLELGQAVDSEKALASVFAELSDLKQSTIDVTEVQKTVRVWVVEDQANERELLATCLRLGGIEVVTARNGREAFEQLRSSKLPNFVLLDMRMPDMDGPDFLEMVRGDARLRNLRIYAVSGSDPSEFNSLPMSIDGWFSKPVRVDALLKVLQEENSPLQTCV
jgi:CheY-like chemotaxis protein/sRNA-binding carbon storage regulator CsrA